MDNCLVKVHILNCEKLADSGLFRHYCDAVPQHRREKIDRVRSDSDKRLLLGAGILLEKVLGEYGTENIKTGEYGKPYIPDCPLHFNLSHSGDIAMLAVAGCEVGCDVQTVKPISMKTAQRFFAESEYKMITDAEEGEERLRLFYRLWALKESYIKATGRGLSQALDGFAVSFDGGKPYVSERYSLCELDIAPDYCAAVCAEASDAECEIINIDI